MINDFWQADVKNPDWVLGKVLLIWTAVEMIGPLLNKVKGCIATEQKKKEKKTPRLILKPSACTFVLHPLYHILSHGYCF